MWLGMMDVNMLLEVADFEMLLSLRVAETRKAAIARSGRT